MTKLIGKEVKITNRDSWYYEEHGIIKDFDGEYYYIAITGDENNQCVFSRDEFKVRKEVRK